MRKTRTTPIYLLLTGMTEDPKGGNDLSNAKPRKEKIKLWLKRLGFAGFMFFLIKGLVWLAIFFGIAKLSCGN